MAIKITATNVDEFQRIDKQVKLIGDNDLIKKFSRADAGIIGMLTFYADNFISNEKWHFPRIVSINRVEFDASEQPKAYNKDGEMETIYHATIWTRVTPENWADENGDKPFDAIFNVWSRTPKFEILTHAR